MSDVVIMTARGEMASGCCNQNRSALAARLSQPQCPHCASPSKQQEQAADALPAPLRHIIDLLLTRPALLPPSILREASADRSGH